MSGDTTAAVWIGNLRPQANEGHLNELFLRYKSYIVSIHVQRDKATKESRGFAFVNFNNQAKAEHAVRRFNGEMFMGKKLKVDIKEERHQGHASRSASLSARPTAQRQLTLRSGSLSQACSTVHHDKPAALWVGSLHRNATEAELRELFSPYRGSISSVRIMRDAKDKRLSRGFGFVNFTNGCHAGDALQSLQGHKVHGLPIKLSLKHSEVESLTATANPFIPSQVSMAAALPVIEKPAEWERQYEHIVVKDVGEDSPEWENIESEVQRTLPDASISSIQRIQNIWLWEKFCQHRQRMSVKNHGRVNEMKLFHGTRKTDPKCIYMSEEGFDMRFSREGLWGRGNYFATKASYSDNYAHELSTGEKQIFYVSVLTGESHRCGADSSLSMPPIREENSQFGAIRYDTVTGATKDTRVYIAYSNDKAYPTYLITYRNRHSACDDQLLASLMRLRMQSTVQRKHRRYRI